VNKCCAVIFAAVLSAIPVADAVSQPNLVNAAQPSEQAVSAARSTIEATVAANLGKTPEEIAAAVVSALQGTPGAVIDRALGAMMSIPNQIAGVTAANSGAVNAALSRVSQVAQVQMRVEAAVAGFGPNANAADVQAAIAQATQGVADVSITNLALGAAQSTQSTQSGASSSVVAALSTAKTIAQSAVTQTQQVSQNTTGQQTGGIQQGGQTPAGPPPTSGGGATGGGGGSGYVRTT
jgi:hypothetical protein